MRGRKPPGPEFVQRLQASEQSKQRLEIILRTLTGELSFTEASALLGISTQRLHDLREQALQAAAAALEPGLPGRPRKPVEAFTPERQELEQLRQELEAARLREEIALLLPGRAAAAPKKKRRRR